MKTMIKNMVLPFICLAFSFSALSAPAWNWSLEVAYLIMDSQGNAQVMFFKDGATYKACGTTEYYTFSIIAPGGEAMNSYLLSAYATKRKVSVLIDCDNNGVVAVRLDKD